MGLMATALALVLVICAATPALAGAPTDQLKASIDQIIKTLDDPTLKSESAAGQRRAAIRQIANTTFDFQEAARRALGRHWQQLSEVDRQEFTSLFSDLLERAYIGKIEQYSGERIGYVGETVDQQSDLATVRTRLTTKSGTEVPVDYRMVHRGDRWLAYDVAIEGLSLIANYRGQFNHIVETSSYQELIKRLRDKADEFGAPSAAQPKRAAPRS